MDKLQLNLLSANAANAIYCNDMQWHAMTNGQWTSWDHQSPDRGAKMCETPSTRWLKAFLKIPKGTTWPAACAWVTWVWGVWDISKEFDVLFENKQWVLNGTCSVSVHHLWLTPHAKSNKSGISPVVRTMQYITRVQQWDPDDTHPQHIHFPSWASLTRCWLMQRQQILRETNTVKLPSRNVGSVGYYSVVIGGPGPQSQ